MPTLRLTSLAIAVSIALVISVGVFAQEQQERPGYHGTIITFDAPGAGTGYFQGTFAFSINPEGAIAGTYQDSGGVFHGYLRAADGTIIESHQAACSTGAPGVSINPEAEIIGFCADANNVSHGFVRTRDGRITWFDAPGAGTGPGQGTLASYLSGINQAETITGSYSDASNVRHDYVRTRDGRITSFDAQGAGTGPSQGTLGGLFDTGGSINPEGAIAGHYLDASYMYHGFFRALDGRITTFDAPGVGTGPYQGTTVNGLNPADTIAGYTVDANNVYHGFLRTRHGSITMFDVPGAGTDPYQGTQAVSINPAGAIVGYTIDENYVYHGFVRAPDGRITTFDAPGAGFGTLALSINPAGVIAGEYLDSATAVHGFLRLP